MIAMNLTDREMLKIAARACDYKLFLHKNTRENYEQFKIPSEDNWSKWEVWNPLEDDGQCFRLANRKEISVTFTDCEDNAPIVVAKYFGGEIIRCNFPDPYKETRRAIVEAVVKQQLEYEEVMNAI